MNVRQWVDKQGGVASLAKRLGMTNQAIYVWINNDRIPDQGMMRIWKVLGISPEELPG